MSDLDRFGRLRTRFVVRYLGRDGRERQTRVLYSRAAARLMQRDLDKNPEAHEVRVEQL